MNKPALTIRAYGETTPDNLAELADHIVDALDAMAESEGIDPTEWRVSAWRFACDGCDMVVDERPSAWVHASGEDFCEPCGLMRVTP